jgi:hypothetical protein
MTGTWLSGLMRSYSKRIWLTMSSAICSVSMTSGVRHVLVTVVIWPCANGAPKQYTMRFTWWITLGI